MKRPPPIVIVFFLHALAQGGMFSRIPDMQLALGLNEAQLGLALLDHLAGEQERDDGAGRLAEQR